MPLTNIIFVGPFLDKYIKLLYTSMSTDVIKCVRAVGSYIIKMCGFQPKIPKR